jgi:hypothetical protein
MDSYEYLRINAGDLTEALASHLDEARWLVDLESGEVVCAGAEELTGLPEEEAWDDPDRFLVIQPMAAFEAFQIMEDFVETLPEGETCRALARALLLPRPFRAFKDTLGDFPAQRERWFKFHQERMLTYAQTWLEDTLPGARLSVG